jgi:hypothetical protein
MDELIKSQWCIDESGTKIVTEVYGKYDLAEVVLAVSDAQPDLLAHICRLHNDWIEERWTDEAFREALERDD